MLWWPGQRRVRAWWWCVCDCGLTETGLMLLQQRHTAHQAGHRTGPGHDTLSWTSHLTSLHWLTSRQMEQPIHPLCCSFSECHLEKSKPVCLCLSMPGVHVQWVYSVQCPAPHHPLTHCHPFSYTHWHTDTLTHHPDTHSYTAGHYNTSHCIAADKEASHGKATLIFKFSISIL